MSSSGASGTGSSLSRRRRALNSSEDFEADPTVQIDTTGFFRVGTPNPLPSLPLESSILKPDSQIARTYLSIKPKLDDALQRAGLPGWNMHFCQRYIDGKRPSIDDTTILVITTRDPVRDNLFFAVNELLYVVRAAKISEWRIEVMDPRAAQLYYIPAVSRQWANTAWHILASQIVNLLDPQTDYWCSVTILNQGFDRTHSEPTVIIGTRSSATYSWKTSVRNRILDLLERSGLGFDVVFVRQSLPCAAGATAAGQSFSEYSGPVEMGSSIGMNDNSGTLGG